MADLAIPGRTASIAAGAFFVLPYMRADLAGALAATFSFPVTGVGADFTAAIKLKDVADADIAVVSTKPIPVGHTTMKAGQLDTVTMRDAAAAAPIVLTGSGAGACWHRLKLDGGALAAYPNAAKVAWSITLPIGASGPKNFGACWLLEDIRDTEREPAGYLPAPTLNEESEGEAEAEPEPDSDSKAE